MVTNSTKAERAMAELRESRESAERQDAYLDALLEAPMPSGFTRAEFVASVRRFAMLAEEAQPRRGLCRFER